MLSDHGISHIRLLDRALICPCCISRNIASVARFDRSAAILPGNTDLVYAAGESTVE
jgi:hypothetical protein